MENKYEGIFKAERILVKNGITYSKMYDVKKEKYIYVASLKPTTAEVFAEIARNYDGIR